MFNNSINIFLFGKSCLLVLCVDVVGAELPEVSPEVGRVEEGNGLVAFAAGGGSGLKPHMGAAEISAGGGEFFFSGRGTTKKDSGRGTIFEI